ncbi:hypothetical protein AQ619_12290 [Caulobacter henricii]|uniref:Uncharacterized protein n=1 Tax=Caulobacter henricii TaxID=69395 RepID=A0A0P0P122_9CAUL|nr:hypothetical protein AQ619_12290 [Caulobacter henricii]
MKSPLPQTTLTTLVVTPRESALTDRFLIPAIAEIEQALLSLRVETDQALGRDGARRYGKPYPLGYCWEISQDVAERLRKRLARPVGPGERAISAFLRNGGSGRHLWGALREKYFQNAFQFGGLYIDVANDTVDVKKPKIEILPVQESGFAEIEDVPHFARIAGSYWGMRIYANHALPSLAPAFPMIGINPEGHVRLQSGSQSMFERLCGDGFQRSEQWLAEGQAPPAALVEALRARCPSHLLAENPVTGQAAALAACQALRAEGAATGPEWRKAMLATYRAIDLIPVVERG